MVDPSHSFYIADYAVFGVTILISIGIGIYYALSGGRQRTTSEYLVGGRTMKFLPVAISLMVSFESSIMMLGLPAEMYVYGVQWWFSCLGYLVSQTLSAIVMVPLLHPLKITSAYEVWYMGIVLFGPAIALEAVTGFPQWGSIFVVAFVAVIYTSIGGIKAVIWTDVFQAAIMYAGMLAILIKGTIDSGGVTAVWNVAKDGGRLDFFNFDFDPRTRHTFWNLFMGALIRGFGLAFNQSTVQRVSSTKTQREATWVLMIMAPCFFLSLSMACYEGIVAFAYYQTKGCDPLASDKINDPNQIIPFTVMDIFKSLPGMPGLFLASLFSASLSTLSSGLSSLSALLWADFIKPRIGEVSEFKATFIAKTSVVIFGLLGCGVALLVSLIGGPLTQITSSLLAAFGGPLTGLFLLGCFSPGANAKGAFAGGLVSLIFTSWLSLGKSFSKNVKREPWLPPASTDMCLANHSASLFSTTPSSVVLASYGQTGSLVNYSHYHNDNVYGSGMYSTAVTDVFDATTQASLDDAPQGIDKIYTLSYQWLTPVGILVTLLIGTVVSVATGGNKEGEVDPRFLISFCDRLCCYMPEPIRKMFRCAEDYTAVQDGAKPPLHEMYLDTEIVVTSPAIGSKGETDPMVLTTELDEPQTTSKIQNGKTQDEEQNGGSYVSFSVPDDANANLQDSVQSNGDNGGAETEQSRSQDQIPGNGQVRG